MSSERQPLRASPDSRIRRLMARPWVVTWWTDPLETFTGSLFHKLTSTGLIIRNTRRKKERSGRWLALSLEHVDGDRHSVGQAFLEEAEVEDLLRLLSGREEQVPSPGALGYRSISLRTHDGMGVTWSRTETVDWSIVLTLRNDFGFTIQASEADELRAFLQRSLDHLRKAGP